MMVSTSAPQLLRFVYYDFKTKSNEAKKINQITTDSRGETWQLTLYPDYPTVALTYKGKRDVNAAISIILRDSRGSVAYERRRGIKQFKGGKTSQQSFLFLIEWSKIINSENEIYRGNDLIIDVEICVVGKSAPPPNPFSQNILKLLDNEDTADVSFVVKDTRVFAHRILLEANAPVLATFCERCDKNTPVPIDGTTPTIFRHILSYVYGGEVPSQEIIQKQGIEILGAADRYGVVGLKLAVEDMIVRSGVVSVLNVVDFLLFADAATAPLLKEYCISYFITRAKDILKSKSAWKLKESGDISFEVMEAMLKSKEKSSDNGNESNSFLSIERLRKKLFKRGILELDGSKKMLLARLHEQDIIERG